MSVCRHVRCLSITPVNSIIPAYSSVCMSVCRHVRCLSITPVNSIIPAYQSVCMSVCRHVHCLSITPVSSVIPVKVTSAVEKYQLPVTVIPVPSSADISTPLAAVVFLDHRP